MLVGTFPTTLTSLRSRHTPKLVVCLREGYDRARLFRDVSAGLTVGVIALPLAMAFGIASIPPDVARSLAERGLPSPPAMGIYTAVIAGFLISALGGSRVQIGGPTGAFIVLIYEIASKHGYEGLAVATVMAGVIVVLLGVAGLGSVIKFIPYPVTTGFTTGIAVIIASSQMKDALGLPVEALPAVFTEKVVVVAKHLGATHGPTLAMTAASLAMLVALRRWWPRAPHAILTVAVAAGATALFAIPVDTIGTRFAGGIPSSLPAPHLPEMSWALVRELVPSATALAMLCAIESLLSAVVADGMTGGRHRSDQELVGQGVANIASAMFFGLPATGAIARTVANVKSGGTTPVAGIVHALALLIILWVAAPLAAAIPLPTLSAVLLLVAWNMAEIDHFRWLLRAPRSDVLVLVTTFLLTVFVDLTVAVGVGMVLAALLFMRRMADVSAVSVVDDDDEEHEDSAALPEGVTVYEIDGPFFFGVADRLKDVLRTIERPPNVFVLRLRKVPAIDATGLHALREMLAKCRRDGTALLLSGVNKQPREIFARTGFDRELGAECIFVHYELALERAKQIAHARGL